MTVAPTEGNAALIDEIRRLADQVRDEEHYQGAQTKRLGRLSGFLAILAAVGSGTVGGVAAASQSLQGGLRTAVVIIAFAGAALSGIAAGVKAPQRAQGAQGRWLELRSLSRRLDAIIAVNLADLSTAQFKALIDDTLDRLDQIQGARDSQRLRLSPAQLSGANPPPNSSSN